MDELRAHMVRPFVPGLLQAPTGAGKSEIMGHIAARVLAKQKRVTFLVNRRVLVEDLCGRVKRLGLEFGVIMSGHKPAPWQPVQVASFDTLRRRDYLPQSDLVFVDECHYSLSDKYSELIQRFIDQGAAVIGATATPVRGLGEGLGSIYKWMVRTPDTPDLISEGFLVPPRVFSPSQPNLKKVEIVGDDYNQKQLEEACDQNTIIGDILKNYLKTLRGKPAIGFGVSLEHCRHLKDLFFGADVRAEYVDHKSIELDRVWSRLANYETEIVWNVGIAGYGWNCPEVERMIEARPTASLALWLQHCGRVMRICERTGKTEARVNDHAGNSIRHGLPDEYRDWPLDAPRRKASQAGEPSLSVAMCKVCYFTFRAGPDRCPACGAVIPVKYRKVNQADGELVEQRRKQQKERAMNNWRSRLTTEYKASKLDEWKRTAREKGYSRGWPFATYERVFKEKVPAKQPVPPPPDVKAALNNWEQF